MREKQMEKPLCNIFMDKKRRGCYTDKKRSVFMIIL